MPANRWLLQYTLPLNNRSKVKPILYRELFAQIDSDQGLIRPQLEVGCQGLCREVESCIRPWSVRLNIVYTASFCAANIMSKSVGLHARTVVVCLAYLSACPWVQHPLEHRILGNRLRSISMGQNQESRVGLTRFFLRNLHKLTRAKYPIEMLNRLIDGFGLFCVDEIKETLACESGIKHIRSFFLNFKTILTW